MVTKTAAQIWRDYETDGVPASSPHDPEKPEIRLWGGEIEALLAAQLTGGGGVYLTQAALQANVTPGNNSGAWVVSDSTPANNGIWRKNGSSGTGSWFRVADLPYSVIGLEITGGTANAIEASSALPVPQSARRALFILVPEDPNTGAVTLAINGATAKALKWQAGEALANGHLQTGVPVLFFDNGSEFRLTQDDSFAGMLGHALAVILAPIGFNWQISVALIPGMAAREVAISALGTVYALSATGPAGADTLGPMLAQQWSLPTALSLLAWYVFAPQCLSTLATIKRESGGWKIPLISVTYLFALAYLAAFATYRLALVLL